MQVKIVYLRLGEKKNAFLTSNAAFYFQLKHYLSTQTLTAFSKGIIFVYFKIKIMDAVINRDFLRVLHFAK